MRISLGLPLIAALLGLQSLFAPALTGRMFNQPPVVALPAPPVQDQPFTFTPTACEFEGIDLGPLQQTPEQLGFECGYVVAPLRHSQPEGPTIRLPIAILRASADNPRPDPLFLVQGGPGGSAFDYFPFVLPNSAIARDRDMVVINQRGADLAEPTLICPETFDALDELLPLPEEESLQQSLDLMRACRQRLADEGIDLSAFNSLENAADMDAVRQALGYDEINFYGVSYGTLLALHLMRDYPDHLRSVILDSVVPTDLNFIPQVPQNQDRIFSAIFSACINDPICAENYPDLEARLAALVAKLNADPLFIELEEPDTGEIYTARLSGKGLLDFLYQVFYLPDMYAIFPRLLTDLERGDLFFVQQIWPAFIFDRTFAEGMYYSVICAEDADFDPNELPLEGLNPLFAEGAREDLQIYRDICDFWQVTELPALVDEPVQSDVPTLLLSGQFDPITPPSFASRAAQSLPNAFNLIDPYGSHGVALMDVCVDQIVLEFLNNPTQPPNAACLDDPSRRAATIPPGAVRLEILAPLNQLEPVFLIQVGLAALFLLGVLSAYLIWPLALLVNVLRQGSAALQAPGVWKRALAYGLALAFGALAIVFAAAATYFALDTLVNNLTYVTLYVVPAAFPPFLLIPVLLVLLLIGMIIAGVGFWRSDRPSIWGKLYYSFIVFSALGYVVILGIHSLLPFT